MKKPVRVAVVGVGHVGAIHANVYAKLKGPSTLVAVCDRDISRAQQVAEKLGCKAVGDCRQLIGMIDAASIAVPTSHHYEVGKKLLEAGVHLLIEKPISSNLSQADKLLEIAKRKNLILQVGHIERFNAAIKTAKEYLKKPRFIEAHRLSPYPFRGTDVSVALDVMIHDLDLVLALVKDSPKRIDALGVCVLSKSEDIANARLSFPSGCVANLTASRVSDETIRRIRVFQEDCYLSIDYREQTVELARKTDKGIERKSIHVEKRLPLDEELESFLNSIIEGSRPEVSGIEARQALALALAIERSMRKSSKTLSPTKI